MREAVATPITSMTAWWSCARKIPYGSRKHAVDVGKSQTKHHGLKYRVYACERCGKWHICKDRKALR
jgi:hypothetical protein